MVVVTTFDPTPSYLSVFAIHYLCPPPSHRTLHTYFINEHTTHQKIVVLLSLLLIPEGRTSFVETMSQVQTDVCLPILIILILLVLFNIYARQQSTSKNMD